MADKSDESATAMNSIGTEAVESLLDDFDINTDDMFLTRRQVLVLAMRERGHDQRSIADHLECSRANVSNIERSARDNIEKANETLSFAKLLAAPVRIELPAGLPLYQVPERIFDACDDAEVKVEHGAPELTRLISSPYEAANTQGTLPESVVVTVTEDGEVHAHHQL